MGVGIQGFGFGGCGLGLVGVSACGALQYPGSFGVPYKHDRECFGFRIWGMVKKHAKTTWRGKEPLMTENDLCILRAHCFADSHPSNPRIFPDLLP